MLGRMVHSEDVQAQAETQVARDGSGSALPHKSQQQLIGVVTCQEKRTWRDPLHAFKKVSNVFSLRIVADTNAWSAGLSSKNSLSVETKRGMTDWS
jgi:hypothetical protein